VANGKAQPFWISSSFTSCNFKTSTAIIRSAYLWSNFSTMICHCIGSFMELKIKHLCG
jgi:hypothetical protein